MKKIFLIILLLFTVLIFVSCADVLMKYEIDTKNQLKVEYSLTIDKTDIPFEDLNVKNFTQSVKKHWVKQGLDVDVKKTDKELIIRGLMIKKFETKEAAYKGLDDIFKSEYSPFEETAFEYSSSYFEDEYQLSAILSTKDLIKQIEGQFLPLDIQEKLISAANSGKYTLSIILPGEIKSSTADEQKYTEGLSQNIWDIKYGESRNIDIITIYKNVENINYYNELNEYIIFSNFLIIGIGALAGILLIILIIILVKRKK